VNLMKSKDKKLELKEYEKALKDMKTKSIVRNVDVYLNILSYFVSHYRGSKITKDVLIEAMFGIKQYITIIKSDISHRRAVKLIDEISEKAEILPESQRNLVLNVLYVVSDTLLNMEKEKREAEKAKKKVSPSLKGLLDNVSSGDNVKERRPKF